MAGNRIYKATRLKLRAGQKIAVRRGFARPDPAATSAGPCRRLAPMTGAVIGLFQPVAIEVPAAQLRFRHVYKPRVEVRPC